MKKIFFIAVLFFPVSLWAVDHQVTNFGDDGNGSLRQIVKMSCLDAGDDHITFASTGSVTKLSIPLKSSLVIPGNCSGAVVISGPQDREFILDGSGIPEGNGTLAIQSWGDTVEGLTFVGNKSGAAIVLENSDNLIQNNFIGVFRSDKGTSPNKVGIQVSGDWNTLKENTVSANLAEGILVEGNSNSIQGNRIGDRNGSCSDVVLPQASDDISTFIREIFHPFPGDTAPSSNPPDDPRLLQPAECGNGGAGIRIKGDQNLVGGDDADTSNRILFNGDTGITVEAAGSLNRHFKNVIAYNGGEGIHLELGANGGIQPLASLQSFPVESDPANGVFHYSLMGQGKEGTTVDLYLVAADETDDAGGQGEGAKYLESFVVSGPIFSQTLQRDDVPPGSRISAIVRDQDGNCSGFSQNISFGRDSDHDGILDPVEDPNSDLVIQTNETDPLLIDTDGDGLPDSVEDKNQNGIVDPGEIDSRKADTDGDGISDFVETGGDGIYDPADGDTDPTNPDTDGDGLKDGDEDKNHNGIIEFGETDPRNSDTDGDGRQDGR